jgi:hypothetical protein
MDQSVYWMKSNRMKEYIKQSVVMEKLDGSGLNTDIIPLDANNVCHEKTYNERLSEVYLKLTQGRISLM